MRPAIPFLRHIHGTGRRRSSRSAPASTRFYLWSNPYPYGPGRYKRRHGRGPCRFSAKNPPHPSADPESTGAPPKIFPDPYLFSSCENSSIFPWRKLSLIIVGNGRIFNQTAQRNRWILRMFLYIIYVFPGKDRPVCFGTPGDTMNFSGILFSRANPAVLSA